MYYTYMLRCEDNSVYTGITTDLDRRMNEHFNKTEKCAKYTKRHQAKKLEVVWKSENKALASKLEYHIKQLNKNNKECLINKSKTLKDVLNEKINVEMYERL